MKIEVEVANRQQVLEAIEARADVIKLNNMQLDEIPETAKLIRDGAPGVVIEVAGEITLDNVAEFGACGVDLISVEAITHSTRPIDISLKTRPL